MELRLLDSSFVIPPVCLCENFPNEACVRQSHCYIANDLQLVSHRNRSLCQRFYMAAGGLSLALWLFMVTVEFCPSLHAWLHGGTIPDNDDCAVVCIAHGKIETPVCVAPVVIVPVTWIEITPRIEFFTLVTSDKFLPSGRAPPVASAVS